MSTSSSRLVQRSLGLLLALFVLSPLTASFAASTRTKPLNLILILVDDLGWSDLSCTGSRFYETPNIDRLAKDGVLFSQAYSACTVCSPTRAALLTGKYPARLRVTDWIKGHAAPKAKLSVPHWTQHLPHSEITLAEHLQTAGYATASIGKWHLGGPDSFPEQHGFDLNVGGYDRGQPPSFSAPYRIPTLTEGPPGEFLTDRESREAVDFIQANQHRPFFLYLPHYAVHEPIAGKPDVVEKYKRKADPSHPHHNPTYAALIESVDDSVSRIRAALERLGLSDQTMIVFTSDNGGLILGKNPPTSNLPLRAGKGSSYEGGVRVPLIVHWPKKAHPGTTVSVPVMSIDLLPTFLDAAKLPPLAVDGQSLVSLLQGTQRLSREALYWHYPHYHPGGATPYSAIRAADFKLIEWFEDERVELYDLKSDPGEQRDLSKSDPKRTASLRTRLAAWRRSVGAQMPSPNPNASATPP